MIDVLHNFFPAYFEWWNIPVLFIAGIVGESFGALIGGGGLITLPALLLVGVPADSAIAINTAAALGTEAGILTETYQKVWQYKRLVLLMAVPILLGGAIGTQLLVTIPLYFVKYSLAAAMTIILLHTYISKIKPNPDKLSRKGYVMLIVFCFFIGFYSNFISVGEGTFSKVGLMAIAGLTFIHSQGLKSTAMMPARMYSLVFTALHGLIVWPYLITKWCSNFIAGKYATKFVKHVPDHYIQRVLTACAIIFIIYLLKSA